MGELGRWGGVVQLPVGCGSSGWPKRRQAASVVVLAIIAQPYIIFNYLFYFIKLFLIIYLSHIHLFY